MKRRVVITGLGAVSAAGEGAQALWQASLESRSGIDHLPASSQAWRPVGAFIKDFVAEKYITQRKFLKVMARDIQLAVAAASLAVEDASAGKIATPRERLGVVVGSGILNHELDELAQCVQNSIGPDGRPDLKKFGQEGMSALFPLWLLKYLPNMSACHVSIIHDLQGPNNTITTGMSAGLQAVGEAARLIERGAADLVLAGAAESKLNPVGFSQYQAQGALSESPDQDPKKAYRPFDAAARGFIAGEGAGFLVLEELEHALARGARIYAELAGFGSSFNQGRPLAMSAALKDAGVLAGDLDYLQASGVGLLEDDLLEAEAIQQIFSSSSLWVSASKPVTGFTGPSTGTLDLILSVLSLKDQLIAPTMNLEKQRKDWDFRIVKGQPLKTRIRTAMTNAFGLNGQCASVIIKSYE